LKRLFLVLLLLIAIGNTSNSYGQKTPFFKNADSLNKKRLITVSVGLPVLWAGSVAALGSVWYKDNLTSNFKIFNDWGHWLAMDKLGHATSVYYTSMVGHSLFKWSGMERKKAIALGGAYGFLYVSSFEIFDGFSTDYGFSWGDITANALGAAFYVGQEFLWDEQRFQLKWSYWPTNYASYRPEILGSNWAERIFKDYNGQTYWLSANIHSFLPEDSKFPRWLNFAVGYSINEMLKSDTRNYTINNGYSIQEFNAYSEYFLTLDIDLSKIKVKSHFLKTLFKTISII